MEARCQPLRFSPGTIRGHPLASAIHLRYTSVPRQPTEVNNVSLLSRVAGAAVCLCVPLSAVTQAQTNNAAASNRSATDGSPYRKLRSVSGATGHEDKGRFVMDDARSVFTTSTDPKVIVYFEWEGPLGPHHFEGLWKSPEGKIVLISDFSYEAKTPHYSGYWTMLLGFQPVRRMEHRSAYRWRSCWNT